MPIFFKQLVSHSGFLYGVGADGQLWKYEPYQRDGIYEYSDYWVPVNKYTYAEAVAINEKVNEGKVSPF